MSAAERQKHTMSAATIPNRTWTLSCRHGSCRKTPKPCHKAAQHLTSTPRHARVPATPDRMLINHLRTALTSGAATACHSVPLRMQPWLMPTELAGVWAREGQTRLPGILAILNQVLRRGLPESGVQEQGEMAPPLGAPKQHLRLLPWGPPERHLIGCHVRRPAQVLRRGSSRSMRESRMR